MMFHASIVIDYVLVCSGSFFLCYSLQPLPISVKEWKKDRVCGSLLLLHSISTDKTLCNVIVVHPYLETHKGSFTIIDIYESVHSVR